MAETIFDEVVVCIRLLRRDARRIRKRGTVRRSRSRPEAYDAVARTYRGSNCVIRISIRGSRRETIGRCCEGKGEDPVEGSETKQVARAMKVTGRSRGLYVRSHSRISLVYTLVGSHAWERECVYVYVLLRARHWWRRGRDKEEWVRKRQTDKKREQEKKRVRALDVWRDGWGGWYAGNVFLGSHGARDASLSLFPYLLSLFLTLCHHTHLGMRM